MNKLLLNCDRVFDVLTRGPFPAGHADDAAVEHHLAACHDCRQLAEALRPAVEVLHEAVTSNEASQLPAYRGVHNVPLTTQRPAGHSSRGRRVDSRLATSSLAGLALGVLLCYVVMTTDLPAAKPGRGSTWFAPTTVEPNAAAMPSEQGLVTLASLQLPAACLPLTHRALSADQASEILVALTDGSLTALRCCTDCHHAGQDQPKSARLVALAQQSCQACHHG